MSKKEKKQAPEMAQADAQEETPVEAPNLEEQIVRMREQYARLQAEFANYKRRTDEQIANSVSLGSGKVLKAMINVVDDFSLALANKQEGKEFHDGMEMIFAKLISTGEELGLERIATVGEAFDPHKHEALLTETSDKPAQEILQELQAGYTYNGSTLRTAKVKVARK